MKLFATGLLVLTALVAAGAQDVQREYWVYATAESDDQVSLIRFGPGGARVEKTITVGSLPTEIEGPHAVQVSPDGKYWYVSIAHGYPYGSIHKYSTETNESVGSAEVGLFPASLDVAGATGLLYVVNFDLHGDMTPSTVSVVETRSMAEVAQVKVGIMPHGSRLNKNGDRQYSAMMMTDELVEIDAFKFEVRRRLGLSEASKHSEHMMSGQMKMTNAEMDAMLVAKPTWVEPDPSGKFVYVACNGNQEVVEVDVDKWEITRRFKTAAGPYNLDITPDGKMLIVSHKQDGTVGFWSLAEGKELARVPTSKKVSHGIATSPDSRYAFVTAEGIGGEPGAVDVFDLQTLKLVSSASIGKQAAGISFWKMR